MTRRLTFTDSAIDDLRGIAEYVAVQSGSAEVADAFLDRLIGHCERLAGLPGILGTARPELAPDIRSTPLGDYLIFFRYREDLLEFAAVVRASRDLARLFGATPPPP